VPRPLLPALAVRKALLGLLLGPAHTPLVVVVVLVAFVLFLLCVEGLLARGLLFKFLGR